METRERKGRNINRLLKDKKKKQGESKRCVKKKGRGGERMKHCDSEKQRRWAEEERETVRKSKKVKSEIAKNGVAVEKGGNGQ